MHGDELPPASQPRESSKRSPDHPSAANRNLLFGIIALQNNFISREALVAGFDTWVQDKTRSLAEILQSRDALSTEDREILERLVGKFLEKHGGDAEKSLAALSSVAELRPELERLDDPDLIASLGHVAESGPVDPRLASTILPVSGSSLGRFRILRPYAKGGLGQVSVALDQDLNREVALKEIQPQHADDKIARERFVVEAEITGGLEHPGIVPVYALGQGPDGRPFYAMRFVKGDSLKRAIEEYHSSDNPNRKDSGARQLALRQLLGRFIDVCNAMEYAHSRGVLHRDLKPGNIMVGKYGETLIVDWGLAKSVGRKDVSAIEPGSDEPTLRPSSALSSSGQTQPGSAIGTPAYMSPEQAAGKLDALGPASDVYSLGATLYHVLCGKPPFNKKDLGDILQKVQRGDFPKPRTVAREVPAALEAICLKAMSVRSTNRYQTARALADDLEHWLADEPIVAAPDSIITRAGRLARKHRGYVRALAFSAVTLAVTATLIHLEKLKSEAALLSASEARRGREMQELQHIRFMPHRVGWVEEGLALGKSAGDIRMDDQLRDEVVAYLVGVDATKLHESQLGGLSAAFHPDGNRLLISGPRFDAGERPGVGFWDPKSNSTEAAVPWGQIAISDKGEGIVWTSAGPWSFSIWNVSQRKKLMTIKLPLPALHEPPKDDDVGSRLTSRKTMAIARDGSLVTASVPLPDEQEGWTQARGATFVWNQQGTLLWRFEGEASSLCFTPDQTLLAVGRENGTIEVFSISNGNLVASFRKDANKVSSLDFCSDPIRVDDARRWLLAAGDSGGTVTIWDVAARQPRAHCLGSNYEVSVIRFSPDGMTLASGGRQAVRLWDYLTGRQLLQFPGNSDDFHSDLAFSADGRQLAISTPVRDRMPFPRVTIWSIELGRGITHFRGMSSEVVKTRLSTDSRLLVALGQNGEIGVFDIDPPRLRFVVRESLGYDANQSALAAHTSALALSPDNKLLAVSSASDARVVHLGTGAVIQRQRLPPGGAASLVFTSDSNLFSYREECLDGRTEPTNNIDREKSPRALRIRNLLGEEPSKPLAEISRFNWNIFSVVVHPQGSFFVVDGTHHVNERNYFQEIAAFDGATGTEIWKQKRSSIMTTPFLAIDPSGTTIALNNGEWTVFVNIPSGEYRGHCSKTALALQKAGGYFAGKWLRFGANRHIVVENWEDYHSAIERDMGIYLCRQGTGEREPAVTLGIDFRVSPTSPCFSLDGRLLSLGTTEGHVFVCDLPAIERRLVDMGFPRWK